MYATCGGDAEYQFLLNFEFDWRQVFIFLCLFSSVGLFLSIEGDF